MTKPIVVCGLLLGLTSSLLMFAQDRATETERRATARKAYADGNFNDAYLVLLPLLSSADSDPREGAQDLQMAVQCLNSLGRVSEIDKLLDAAVKAQPKNWRIHSAAALALQDQQHMGMIVAGQFERGHGRGRGEAVSSAERDRVQALQWFAQATRLAAEDGPAAEVGQLYLNFAEAMRGQRYQRAAWELQLLTDLQTLPDLEKGVMWWRGTSERGAPVDADGQPVFYNVPESWEAAANDGQRWRWLMKKAVDTQASLQPQVTLDWANFLLSQFGVQTMAGRFAHSRETDLEAATGPFAVHTLADNETIALLATGVKRFTLPDEFNPIAQFRLVMEQLAKTSSPAAADALASVYENRRQYVKAAEVWQTAIERFGSNEERAARLKQIIGNWGEFDGTSVQPAGSAATLGFRFRNAKSVSLTAQPIKIELLLNDVKAYLKSNPAEFDWQQTNIQDIGYRLVTEGGSKYLDAQSAEWSQTLEPKPGHADRLIDIETPLEKAGAYMVKARVADGNESLIIVWLADTAIVKKPLDQQTWYFVADSVTGQPVARANVEFFGWKQEVRRNATRPNIVTKNFAEFTDAQGQVHLSAQRLPTDYQWLAVARTDAGRLAYIGFSGVWYYGRGGEPPEQSPYLITDRPVYRPGQEVKFKVWLQRARYDRPDDSPFANRKVTVVLHNPRGEEILTKQFTADQFGGFDSTWPIPQDAQLGAYHLSLPKHGGAGSFRVEEYKKPEFEVTIEAPDKPVQLGDTISATIRAKYYFGSPVTSARVKYKVERTQHTARWFPPSPWDWLYGTGYWWFGNDYSWYPGWSRWGTARPVPSWWGRSYDPPEIVAEQEVAIGPDGTVAVSIDTLAAKELHGDEDHSYRITAEVVDESRRTIVGTGQVLVARQPFQVNVWLNRGFYQTGETIDAEVAAFTLDRRPVTGTGKLVLHRIEYQDGTPQETEVSTWDLAPGEDGRVSQQLTASTAGQYRLSYTLTDSAGHAIEGACIFLVRGSDFRGDAFRFNDLELVTDKKEYAPGDTVRLLVNTNRTDSHVVLFLRPSNSTSPNPIPVPLRLAGKSAVYEVPVAAGDMPNFFIEALTISAGKVHSEVREVVVPPRKQLVDVKVEPSGSEYLPGAAAKVTLRLTDRDGKPFVGSTVLSVYDRSLDYIAGGSNVADIREHFWSWKRHHSPQRETNLDLKFHNLVPPGQLSMTTLGVFGDVDAVRNFGAMPVAAMGRPMARGAAIGGMMLSESAAPAAAMDFKQADGAVGGGGADVAPPALRTEFADTAYWNAAVTTDADGVANVDFKMPDNLTAWTIRAWSMGRGARVGQGSAEVVTRKNLLVRPQTPRFLVESDTVVLSANIHNYLSSTKSVRVVLELDGNCLEAPENSEQTIELAANGEMRVDWKVKALHEGTAIVRMKALSDEESDAIQLQFPVLVHGMLKTESFARAMRPTDMTDSVTFTVPEQRRVNESRLEARFSPTLAGAMVDALPYLVDYPYGCTEQTLNRFLPTVITQRILQRMQVDLAAVQKHRNNLNTQELGDPAARAAQWKRFDRNPVFNTDEVVRMTKDGVDRLTSMQLADGGWGWFSGSGERSTAHTTAVVVHGLQIAQQNEVALVPEVLERGVEWLQNYQKDQLQRLKNAASQTDPWKSQADATDALVYMILVDADVANQEMQDALYRDRLKLPVYAQALFGLALHQQQQTERLNMVLENISQFLVQDEENQTAYLQLPENNWWWYWYGSQIEANAYYLKLLTAVNPQDPRASRLVKYLLNNRKHATYWDSTRDTALCIEALAEYFVASGEAAPNLQIEIWLDGQKQKDVTINASNLFTFDNTFVLMGDAVTTGEHTLRFKKAGTGPLYFNVYVTNFTKEDFITHAGLEVKVNRKLYKLTRVDQTTAVSGSRGQAVEQAVEKFERKEIENLGAVTSGDLVEVELEIESKNDYEYLIFEDLKAAGFEPVDLRSGYTGNSLHAYVEYRDERTAFFIRALPRGRHSLSYRLRAEIPGQFSALPARAAAMYAPELRGNSDEAKVVVEDRPTLPNPPPATDR